MLLSPCSQVKVLQDKSSNYSEEVEKTREQNAAFLQRMRAIAERDKGHS